MDISLELKPFYKDYGKIKRELICNSSLKEDELFNKLTLRVNNNEKYEALFFVKLIYEKYKYCDYNTVVLAIKEAGFNDDLLKASDFINLSALEKIAINIYKSGFPFSFYGLMEYVNAQIETNISQRMQIRYSGMIEKIPYEKDRIVTQIQLDIENAHRRIKYKKTHKPLDEFAQFILNLDVLFRKGIERLSNNEVDIPSLTNEIKKSMSDPQNTMQFLGKIFFESIKIFCECIEEPKTTKQIFFAFEPVFRVIFESNKRGLYSREDFDNLSYHIYDGYYNKYHMSRLKTLTGYK